MSNPRRPPEPDPEGDRATVARPARCGAAARSSTGFTGEIAHLLRTRLRQAILIVLVGFTFHFLKHLFLPWSTFDDRPQWLVFGGCDIALMATASALLWSHLPLSMRSLRLLELAVFGSIAAFFGWLQVDRYHDGALLRALLPEQGVVVSHLTGRSAGLTWFLLIVLYGTFIPNTWRRCAAVVAGLAVLPVAVCVADSRLEPATGAYVLSGLPELILLMATAAAIAVFGSYKIRELHEQAHQAQRIGQYRLKQVLGFGGMGTVYLAEHVLLRRPCALKLIRPDEAGDSRVLARFEREVQATAALTHPNTVEVYDYGHTEDGTFYYVMEYLPGMNLEDLVERYGPMPPGRAVYLLRQVCGALREAHAVGLIHRDIKPSNIIACERGKVYDVAKLLDFGLVKTAGTTRKALKLTGDGALAGSPAFMSPEQARGQVQLDGRSDIYNVGAVAYFLVTGKLPFDRLSAVEMLHAHGYESFVPGPEFQASVPPDLQRVVLRCLEKDPGRRYPNAAALERALAACECAGQWTAENAQAWWRQHADGTAPAPPPAAPQGEQQTTVAAP